MATPLDKLFVSLGSESPTSVLPTPKMQTIFSAVDELYAFDERASKKQTSRRRNVNLQRKNRLNGCQSVAELEFEELKGFMDLGFVFSEDDQRDTELVSIVPGLRILGKAAARGNEERFVQRPYLSEAWEVLEKKEAMSKPTTMIQKISDDGIENETAMKEQIKLWARSVASAIR